MWTAIKTEDDKRNRDVNLIDLPFNEWEQCGLCSLVYI